MKKPRNCQNYGALSTVKNDLVLALVYQLVFCNPGHHGTQLLTNLLDFGFGNNATTRSQRGRTCYMLEDETLGIFTILNLLQALAHGLAGVIRDDAWPGLVLTKLGVVGDGVVHVGDPALVYQVNDELELVQALKIRHLGCITCLNQCVKAGPNQLYRAPAQYGLLTKEVRLSFLAESGLDNAGTSAAIGAGIRHANITSGTGIILVNGNQMRYATALGVGAAHGVARSLGGYHNHIHIITRYYLPIVHIKAVGESQGSALLHVTLDVIPIHLGNMLIGQQDHYHISILHSGGNFSDLQAGIFGLGPGLTALAQPNHNVHAGIMEVKRMRMRSEERRVGKESRAREPEGDEAEP